MANILVVDDEMGIRELLSEILSDEGHVILTAENAQQARDARAASVPDLVLLDIWMPDTDGVTLLKEWQRDGLLTMPVIMMSGHATIDTAVEATRIGALNFLEKPIALQDLLLPASFAIASYRASMLPLLGDVNESALQGATANLARLPLVFQSKDKMQKVQDAHIAALSVASISAAPAATIHTISSINNTGTDIGKNRETP